VKPGGLGNDVKGSKRNTKTSLGRKRIKDMPHRTHTPLGTRFGKEWILASFQLEKSFTVTLTHSSGLPIPSNSRDDKVWGCGRYQVGIQCHKRLGSKRKVGGSIEPVPVGLSAVARMTKRKGKLGRTEIIV